MDYSSLEDRIEILPSIIGKSLNQISQDLGWDGNRIMNFKNGKGYFRVSELECLGNFYDLIPVVFFNDDRVETGGDIDFLYGNQVDNYIWDVFDRHMQLNNENYDTLGDVLDKYPDTVRKYRSGGLNMRTEYMETLAQHFGLSWEYLRPIESGIPPSVFQSVNKAAGVLRSYEKAADQNVLINHNGLLANTKARKIKIGEREHLIMEEDIRRLKNHVDVYIG